MSKFTNLITVIIAVGLMVVGVVVLSSAPSWAHNLSILISMSFAGMVLWDVTQELLETRRVNRNYRVMREKYAVKAKDHGWVKPHQ